MHTIEATYRINTPMFIAGANQQEAELRIPSFKGALRFWWRALAYGRYNGDLAQIKKNEDEIFGSTKGQAHILMSLNQHPPSTSYNFNNLFAKRPGSRYLAYGIPEAKRNYIDKGNNLTIKIISKNMICENVKNALIFLGLFGGIGSRSRKGYGSITLKSLQIDNENFESIHPMNYNEFKKISDEILNKHLLSDIPPYSAFSRNTRIELLKESNDPLTLLNSVGEQIQRYRSWGHNGKVNENKSEYNFPDDHNWIKRIQQEFPPKRLVFGLPYNEIELKNIDKINLTVERRASPLFLHIHYFDENRYGAIATIFESQFLPKNIHIKTGQKLHEPKADYSVLHDFIDGRIGPKDEKTKEHYFPDRKTILGKQVKTEGLK